MIESTVYIYLKYLFGRKNLYIIAESRTHTKY